MIAWSRLNRLSLLRTMGLEEAMQRSWLLQRWQWQPLMSEAMMAAVPGAVLSSHSDTAFQAGCPHGMTTAVLTAAHLPLVLFICSPRSSASHWHLPTILPRIPFLPKGCTISFCWLQSGTLAFKNPSKWWGGGKNQKNLCKLEKLMGERGEAVARRRYWDLER